MITESIVISKGSKIIAILFAAYAFLITGDNECQQNCNIDKVCLMPKVIIVPIDTSKYKLDSSICKFHENLFKLETEINKLKKEIKKNEQY